MDKIPNCMYDYWFEEDLADVIFICDNCGYEIYEGDEYYNIFDNKLCKHCIDKFKRIAE